MIDEAYGVEGPCECCGKFVDDCICEACPRCDTYGDPNCYKEHGMEYTAEQLAGQEELEEHYRAEREREDAMYREYLEEEKYDGEQEERKLRLRYDDKEVFRGNSDDDIPSIFDEE
jgi:hypothetical protein